VVVAAAITARIAVVTIEFARILTMTPPVWAFATNRTHHTAGFRAENTIDIRERRYENRPPDEE
jgi:hypothetical protein